MNPCVKERSCFKLAAEWNSTNKGQWTEQCMLEQQLFDNCILLSFLINWLTSSKEIFYASGCLSSKKDQHPACLPRSKTWKLHLWASCSLNRRVAVVVKSTALHCLSCVRYKHSIRRNPPNNEQSVDHLSTQNSKLSIHHTPYGER